MRRAQCEGNVYHVVARGVGRQLIFEDDFDRRYFKKALKDQCGAHGVELYAWCLMENHVHILFHSTLDQVSNVMHHVETGYAKYFNKKYDRVGSLFQGRFKSVPVVDDEQLMTAVRYIHLNPVKAGGVLDDPWSSYSEYIGNAELVSREFVLDVFGGKDRFEEFHHSGMIDSPAVRSPRVTQHEAEAIVKQVLGDINPFTVKSLPREERDKLLRKLKEEGLSIRQIERVTSIGRGIIARA